MLLLEYVQHGDLLGFLRKSRGMEDKYYSCPESLQEEVTSYHLLSFAQQIASGMSFLASKKVDVFKHVYGFKFRYAQIHKFNTRTRFHVNKAFHVLFFSIPRFFTVILLLEMFWWEEE